MHNDSLGLSLNVPPQFKPNRPKSKKSQEAAVSIIPDTQQGGVFETISVKIYEYHNTYNQGEILGWFVLFRGYLFDLGCRGEWAPL
jgi:hypothetical protein